MDYFNIEILEQKWTSHFPKKGHFCEELSHEFEGPGMVFMYGFYLLLLFAVFVSCLTSMQVWTYENRLWNSGKADYGIITNVQKCARRGCNRYHLTMEYKECEVVFESSKEVDVGTKLPILFLEDEEPELTSKRNKPKSVCAPNAFVFKNLKIGSTEKSHDYLRKRLKHGVLDTVWSIVLAPIIMLISAVIMLFLLYQVLCCLYEGHRKLFINTLVGIINYVEDRAIFRFFVIKMVVMLFVVTIIVLANILQLVLLSLIYVMESPLLAYIYLTS